MIHGPRTISSPEALPSRGSSLPSSSTIFMSTPNTARPCLACTARRSSASSARCSALSVHDRAERAHLGHAPGVQHLHVVALLEGAHHRRRAGRAADDRAAHRAELQVVAPRRARAGPARRSARRPTCVTPSLSNSSCSDLPSSARAREHQLGADHARDVRQAPGVDVEHRHHRQDDVARRAVQRIGQRRGVGVQHRRAVAVERALRVAGRARGVAQRRGGVLVEARPVELGRHAPSISSS